MDAPSTPSAVLFPPPAPSAFLLCVLCVLVVEKQREKWKFFWGRISGYVNAKKHDGGESSLDKVFLS